LRPLRAPQPFNDQASGLLPHPPPLEADDLSLTIS
jgi:hypothetical protein